VRADVVGAADEGEPRPDAHDRAPEEAERGRRRRQRHRVPDHEQDEPERRAAARAPAVGRAAAGDLHRHVQQELDGDEQPDRRQPDAIGMALTRRDWAERGEVPAGGRADRDAARCRLSRQMRSSTTTGISRSVFVAYSS
jgi:hypothetical protein